MDWGITKDIEGFVFGAVRVQYTQSKSHGELDKEEMVQKTENTEK